jgi:hypothetical protein
LDAKLGELWGSQSDWKSGERKAMSSGKRLERLMDNLREKVKETLRGVKKENRKEKMREREMDTLMENMKGEWKEFGWGKDWEYEKEMVRESELVRHIRWISH